LRLLGRREHSARELRHKLEQRGYGTDEAASAVDALTQDGWQSDARYVELVVRSRIAQGCGPLRIEAELQEAGVADAAVREALHSTDADWNMLAAEARTRRFSTLPKKASDWQKQYRYLAGRGFEASQIYFALKGK
jgi:regulatory protein